MTPVGHLAGSRRVLADLVDLLYRQAPVSFVITLVVAAIVGFELWDAQHRKLLLAWEALTVLVTAARALSWFAYFRGARRSEHLERWLRWYALGALATGVLWGIAGAEFFPLQTDERKVFLAFLLAGMLASGIPVFSAFWWVYAAYGVGIVLPFTYVLAIHGTRLHAELALLVPFFFAVNVAVALRLSRVFSDGFRLRHAHERLAQDHADLNNQIQEQIDELLQAQREIEASGRKLALFAERAPIAVFDIDGMRTILDMNPAAENTFGYSATELSGRNLQRMLFPPEEPLNRDEWWSDFMNGRQPASGVRASCMRRDGIEIMCEFSLTPLVNDEGDLISVIVQGRDITQQLEVERVKKEFTSTLSHELRTPLTSIIGSLQLINSGMMGDLEQEVAELTQVAERNGQRLLDLINDLLDIEKIESGKLTLSVEPISIDALVRDALVLNRGFADRYKVRVAVRGDVPVVTVNGDYKRLLQIMTNLISNAAKFSPEGELIDVEVKIYGNTVKVTVEDRGPGIPAEFRPRIFSRFAQADSTYTRQKGGTGLGLAICKRLIEHMNGQIGFLDREGGGSIFYFDLPIAAVDAATPIH
ncbi:MAG: PAS domain-containing sensor histidine kinase [Betaproteobacteria bacterium]|nr:PAS domain-containing sensor histidine kinase [Betaproteobacteria bacterium]